VPQDLPIGADPNRQKLLVSQEQMTRTQDRLTNAERLATETGGWVRAGCSTLGRKFPKLTRAKVWFEVEVDESGEFKATLKY
jgi:hypothetical protein